MPDKPICNFKFYRENNAKNALFVPPTVRV